MILEKKLIELREKVKEYKKVCDAIFYEKKDLRTQKEKLEDELAEEIGFLESELEKIHGGKILIMIPAIGQPTPLFDLLLSSDIDISKGKAIKMALSLINKAIGSARREGITISTEKPPVDPEDPRLKKLDRNESRIFNEVLKAYSTESYTLSVMGCRTILQSLIDKAIKKHSLTCNRPGLASKIGVLEKNKVIKGHHKEITSIAKFFGDESAHRVSQIFDKTKANLVISAVLILIEEVF